MKPKEIMSNIQFNDKTLVNDLLLDDQDHPFTKLETPLREDAFDLNDEEKIEIIEKHFKEIMLTLGLDLLDESLRGTPHRVAKMYVKELFSGLNQKTNRP